MNTTSRFDDVQVRVTTHETVDPYPACDNCHTPNTGLNGVHWDAQNEPVGLLNVCDTQRCLDFALATALDDAPVDSIVTCEQQIRPAAMTLGVAA